MKVLSGVCNLALGYIVVCRVGTFELRKTDHVVAFGLGVLLIGPMGARPSGRFHGGLL